MESKLEELTSLVRHIVVRQQSPVQEATLVCNICFCSSHPTYACPTLQYASSVFPDQFVAVAGYFPDEPQFQQQQQSYDPFFNTYNPGWRDYSDLGYGNAASQQQQYEQPFQQITSPAATKLEPSWKDLMNQMDTNNYQFQQITSPTTTKLEPSLEDLMKTQIEFQQNFTATIQDLTTQIEQLTTTVNELRSQESDQLSSQTIPNSLHSNCHIDLPADLVEETHDELCAEFPDFIDFNDSINCNSCTDCDGDIKCVICAEISAYLKADDSVYTASNDIEGSISNAVAESETHREVELKASEEFSKKEERQHMTVTTEVDFVFGPWSNIINESRIAKSHVLHAIGEVKEIEKDQWDPNGSPHVSSLTWSLHFNQWDPNGRYHVVSTITWSSRFNQWDPGGVFSPTSLNKTNGHHLKPKNVEVKVMSFYHPHYKDH